MAFRNYSFSYGWAEFTSAKKNSNEKINNKNGDKIIKIHAKLKSFQKTKGLNVSVALKPSNKIGDERRKKN